MLYNTVGGILAAHIEISSTCNAKCPACPRSEYPTSPMNQLYPSDLLQNHIKQLPNLRKILLCGNFGDPLAHPHIGDICQDMIKYLPKLDSITIHTNGSLGAKQTWVQLAELPTYVDVFFGIDGLSDTLEIYRRNVNYDAVMKNVKIFIDHGGRALWKWIDFPHTRHQIKKARKLSKKIGFERFVVTQPWDSLIEGDGNIKCKAISNRQNRPEVYIDSQGNLWPCCWTGKYFKTNRKSFKTNDSNNLHHHQIKDIIKTELFATKLEESWNSRELAFKPCLENCAEHGPPFTSGRWSFYSSYYQKEKGIKSIKDRFDRWVEGTEPKYLSGKK